MFHGALGYAVELGLLPANPLGLVHWHAPKAAIAISPAAVASPVQVRAILDQAARERPELAAFFGCLYYAALRPEEAVAPRRDDLILPAHGRGTIILTTACPRTGTAWTTTRAPHEPRGLKHRPAGTIRVVPIPRAPGTPPARPLGPDLGATPLARRPYDLRHAALSLWLNASVEPAEVAARAGNSARVLYEVYLHCTDGQDDVVSQRIEDALDAGTGITHSPRCGTASGYTHRRLRPDPVRYMSVNLRRQPAPGPQSPARAEQDRSRRPPRSESASAVQTASCGSLCGSREQPALAHA